MVKKGNVQDGEFVTAQAIEAAQAPEDNTITLSTGVVLRGKKTNPVILVQVMGAFPRPEPPLVYIEKMGREMENPDDPNYLEKLQSWKMEFANHVVTAMVSLGTELISAPKALSHPEKNDWLADYSLLGLPMHPDHKQWRYLAWVKYKAIGNEEDMKKIQEMVGRLNGVRESSVKSAENFPGGNQEPG